MPIWTDTAIRIGYHWNGYWQLTRSTNGQPNTGAFICETPQKQKRKPHTCTEATLCVDNNLIIMRGVEQRRHVTLTWGRCVCWRTEAQQQQGAAAVKRAAEYGNYCSTCDENWPVFGQRTGAEECNTQRQTLIRPYVRPYIHTHIQLVLLPIRVHWVRSFCVCTHTDSPTGHVLGIFYSIDVANYGGQDVVQFYLFKCNKKKWPFK